MNIFLRFFFGFNENSYLRQINESQLRGRGKRSIKAKQTQQKNRETNSRTNINE